MALMTQKEKTVKGIAGRTKITSKERKSMKAKDSVQKAIPYSKICGNGIIETRSGHFTKSYPIKDIDFTMISGEDQEVIYEYFGQLLNGFAVDIVPQITIFNRSVPMETIKDNFLMKLKNDNLNEYREEYNEMLLGKMEEGNNNIVREKYLTISIKADSVSKAIMRFNTLDNEINTAIKRITKEDVEPMTITKRLSILYDIYNKKSSSSLEGSELNLGIIERMGLTSKDIIAPNSLVFPKKHRDSDYFMAGDVYGRAMCIMNFPTTMQADLLNVISTVPCNMLTSVYFMPTRKDIALKMIREKKANVSRDISERNKNAMKEGYFTDYVAPDLAEAKDETDGLLDDVMRRNQKIFFTTLLVTIFADSKEELEDYTTQLDTKCKEKGCELTRLRHQQKNAFNSSLPLANLSVEADALDTTESASLLLPFANLEMMHKNGVYYGLNGNSNNLTMFDRTKLKNGNGVVLGKPGSGKSFIAKKMLIFSYLSRNDDFFIIDPEGEYSKIAEELGGQVIRLANGSATTEHINPFDMDVFDTDDRKDPVSVKSDFLASLCQLIKGTTVEMSPYEKSIIDRCVRKLYEPYLEHMADIKDTGITCDYDAMPTLADFYDILMKQEEQEAEDIALSIERYVLGSQNAFSFRTNVNKKSRLVVYDIRDLAGGMMSMAIQICINDIWGRMISNFKEGRGKLTWFFVDEAHLLLANPTSGELLKNYYKRGRKFGGILTSLTQNTEEFLRTEHGRTILSNSECVIMLDQAPLDRANLSALYNFSQPQIDFITNAESGKALLYDGTNIIPIKDKFPTWTKLYKLMSTKIGEQEKSLAL